MAEPSTGGAPNPSRFECTVEIDTQFASRVAAGMLRYLYVRPGRLIRIVVLSLVVAAVLTLAAPLDGIAPLRVFLLGLVVVPAIYFLIVAITFRLAKNQVNDRIPVGSLYSITMTEDTMAVKYHLVTTEVSYELYKSLRASKSVVLLKPRQGRNLTILPRELFAEDSLAWLGSKLRHG